MIHTHFNDCRLVVFLKAEKCFWHTNFVIKITCGTKCIEFLLNYRIHHTFCCCFTYTSRKSNKWYVECFSIPVSNTKKSLTCILHKNESFIIAHFFTAHNCPCTFRKHIRNEIMCIKAFTYKSNKQCIFINIAAIC